MTDITSRVLLDKKGEGAAYVELFDDGRVKAGYFVETAKTYQSVEEALAHFRESFNHTNSHGAWNICYTLEDYIGARVEGM